MISNIYARIRERFFGDKINATLDRFKHTKDATYGWLHIDGSQFAIIERPWLNNEPRVSCIPEGKYLVKPFSGKRFKDVYEITNVHNRSAILIHQGNYVTDSIGCAIIGMKHGTISGEPAVLSSKTAMNSLRSIVGQSDFWLTIRSSHV